MYPDNEPSSDPSLREISQQSPTAAGIEPNKEMAQLRLAEREDVRAMLNILSKYPLQVSEENTSPEADMFNHCRSDGATATGYIRFARQQGIDLPNSPYAERPLLSRIYGQLRETLTHDRANQIDGLLSEMEKEGLVGSKLVKFKDVTYYASSEAWGVSPSIPSIEMIADKKIYFLTETGKKLFSE